MKIFLLAFTFYCISFVNCSDSSEARGRPKNADCVVSYVDLLKLKVVLRQITDEGETTDSECDALVRRTINLSSKWRNKLRKEVKESDNLYTETEINRKADERNLSKSLSSVPNELKRDYGTAFARSTNQIKTVLQDIENVMLDNIGLTGKLLFYEHHLNSSSISSKRLCSLEDESGEKLISILGEISEALKGQRDSDNCEYSIVAIVNAESLEAQRREFDEKKLGMLNKYYDERKHLMQQLIDDNNEQLHDTENINADLSEFENELNDLNSKNDLKRKLMATKSFEFIVKMIREGRVPRDAREVLSDSGSSQSKYHEAIVKAYDCTESNINNVVRFIDLFGKSGLSVMRDQIKNCQQLHHPMIIKLALELDDATLGNSVDAVYRAFGGQIRGNNLTVVSHYIKTLGDKVIDLPRLVRLTYDRKTSNMEAAMAFIDSLNDPKKKLEKVLYDEMMRTGAIDTVEHVMFGFWIMKKIVSVDQLPIDLTEIHLLKQPFEELKQRLPEGIRFLFFEPYVILASKDFSYLVRAFGMNSVKFQAIPSNNAKYFVFKDTRDDRKIFLTAMDGDQIATVGKGDHQGNYWQIIPTNNAEFFYIKSFSGYYLSADERKVCAEEKTTYFGLGANKCVRYDVYNKAYPTNFMDNQKWMITTSLIRNQMLADRTLRKV